MGPEAVRSLGLDCDAYYIRIPEEVVYQVELWNLRHTCDGDPPTEHLTPEVSEKFVILPGSFEELCSMKYRMQWRFA